MKREMTHVGELVMFAAVMVTIWVTVSSYVQWAHVHSGNCDGESCNWIWCKH